jgi:TldD protein
VAPSRTVDETFLALPLAALTDAALTRAVDLGCEHADIRVERIHTQTVSLRDARPESFTDGEDLGLAVRVVHDGTWGFASGVVLTAAEAVRLAEEAVSRSTATRCGSPITRSTRSGCPTARRARC